MISIIEEQNAYDAAFSYLSEMILAEKIKMGDILDPPKYLAKEADVDIDVMREVLRLMEGRKILETQHNGRMLVCCDTIGFMSNYIDMLTTIKEVKYSEVLTLRKGFEFAAIELAIQNITDEELAEMQKILNSMDTQKDRQDRAKLDMCFHRALVEASHSRLLISCYNAITAQLTVFILDLRKRIGKNEEQRRKLREYHMAIYNALVVRNMDDARAALRRHMRVVDEHMNISNL